ncbi:MAG: hypothetical protein LYZ70_04455 [Nitrososphaerales archaeon]|nr:hypothetical protein [Nitrososphaerales archaeon]
MSKQGEQAIFAHLTGAAMETAVFRPLNWARTIIPVIAVSTRELKERAMKLLPEGSPTRAAILSQPDEVPEGEAEAVAKALSRVLSGELMR